MTATTSARLLQFLTSSGAQLREQAREGDRLRRLPAAVVGALVDQGLFRLWIPRSRGGFELSLPEALQVYEAAAFVDGSVGWAVMIGSGGGLFAARLDEAAAETIFRPADAVIAGSGAPTGAAERVAGGYRVSGRWRFASGADYATTFTANCRLQDTAGRESVRAMAFRREDVRVLPTWDADGMRATGSHDFEVDGVFVPEAHSFDVFAGPPREPGPLYRIPFGVLTELPVTAVALGVAQRALREFATLVLRKRSAGAALTLGEEATVQQAYASARARLGFVRTRVTALSREAWRWAVAGDALPDRLQGLITASAAEGVDELCTVTGRLARLAGMSAVAREEAFARAWRDLQTLAAHVSVSPRQLAAAGATLLKDASEPQADLDGDDLGGAARL